MALEAQIVDSATGRIDPDLSVGIGIQQHGALFAHPGLQASRFPFLTRISDFYSDAEYATEELETLIAELEEAAVLFGLDSAVCRFLGPLHSLCCLAFLRKKSVVLYAD